MTKLINLCDKMSDLADEGRAVDIAYLDFSKASETASHKILIGEVFTNGLVKQTLRGTENCLKTTQKTVMSITRSITGGQELQCTPGVHTESSPF